MESAIAGGGIFSGVTCFHPHLVIKDPRQDSHAHMQQNNTTTTGPKLIYWNVDLERPQRENNKQCNLHLQLKLHL